MSEFTPGAPSEPGAVGSARSTYPATSARVAQLESANRRLTNRNEGLVAALEATRTQLVDLRARVGLLDSPPMSVGTCIARIDERTAEIDSAGRRMRVAVSPQVGDELVPGADVRLNESLAIVAVGGCPQTGQVLPVHECWGDDRVVVASRGDNRQVVRRSAALMSVPLRAGDLVLVDTRAGFAHELVPAVEVEDLILEEVPDISYDDIGGLDQQIEIIRDAIELPYLHPELFREHHVRPPKGVLLYGPPGCGKTLIAKAVAASLARQGAASASSAGRSYFLNVKGPELLNKFVGETERQIRVVFAKAREHASEGAPVIVFFDEMESIFRTRGSGVSSDVETTIVPQLLAEIDGVEGLNNVIIIGASNREDMLDPAIMRPGRLDTKIRIQRPDEAAARDIFRRYLTPDLPLRADELAAHGGSAHRTVDALIAQTAAYMFQRSPEHLVGELVYASGRSEQLFFAELASGAMVSNIVDRAKRAAIKEVLAGGPRGISAEQLRAACAAEFAENEDLAGIHSPDDWARVLGRRGDRIVQVRPVARAEVLPEVP